MSDTGLLSRGTSQPLRPRATRLFATLFLFWILLNGSLSVAILISGLVVAGVIMVFFARNLSFLSGFNLTPAGIGAALLFIGYFLKELVKANLALAKLVLTPGTLTCEIKDEFLYVHWVVAQSTDTEAATQEIVAGFERYLEVMYG